MQPLVELRNITFGYGAEPALEKISLHLHPGQFAALVGPSGAGKTSLLKLILGVLQPTHGEVYIDGQALSGEVVVCAPEARRQANAHATRVEHELLLYVLHGMLHLSGFDDRTDADYRRMHRTEDMVLSKLGVGKVFAADDGAPRKVAKRGAAANARARKNRKGDR